LLLLFLLLLNTKLSIVKIEISSYIGEGLVLLVGSTNLLCNCVYIYNVSSKLELQLVCSGVSVCVSVCCWVLIWLKQVQYREKNLSKAWLLNFRRIKKVYAKSYLMMPFWCCCCCCSYPLFISFFKNYLKKVWIDLLLFLLDYLYLYTTCVPGKFYIWV
jgi:hypothetical protein